MVFYTQKAHAIFGNEFKGATITRPVFFYGKTTLRILAGAGVR